MNFEAKESGISKITKISSQRVSVIKWFGTGRESTIASQQESPIAQGDCTISAVHEQSSVSVAKPKGEKTAKFRCSFCEKSFKWRSHWQSHERTHTGAKPYGCEICGKRFARSDGLQCHKLTHIARKNHRNCQSKLSHSQVRCADPCNYVPPNTAERVSCVVSELEQKNLFNCGHCNRVLFSSAGVLKHMHSHKGKR